MRQIKSQDMNLTSRRQHLSTVFFELKELMTTYLGNSCKGRLKETYLKCEASAGLDTVNVTL